MQVNIGDGKYRSNIQSSHEHPLWKWAKKGAKLVLFCGFFIPSEASETSAKGGTWEAQSPCLCNYLSLKLTASLHLQNEMFQRRTQFRLGGIGLSSRGRTVGFRVWVREMYHFLIFIQGCPGKKN